MHYFVLTYCTCCINLIDVCYIKNYSEVDHNYDHVKNCAIIVQLYLNKIISFINIRICLSKVLILSSCAWAEFLGMVEINPPDLGKLKHFLLLFSAVLGIL